MAPDGEKANFFSRPVQLGLDVIGFDTNVNAPNVLMFSGYHQQLPSVVCFSRAHIHLVDVCFVLLCVASVLFMVVMTTLLV